MLNTDTLGAFLKARGWSRSELARRVGVSRQAVSLWFQNQPTVGIRGDHLLAVSRALEVPVEVLVDPLPLAEDGESVRAALLWDRLYPDLVDFALAAGRFQPRAVGRLVEVYGPYAAAKILGQRVWSRFDDFKRYIHPARRQPLEALVQWRRNRTAA